MTKWISTIVLPNGVSIEGEFEELDHLCKMPTCGNSAVRFECPKYRDIRELIMEDWCNEHLAALNEVAKKVSAEAKKPSPKWWRPSTWRRKGWLGDNPFKINR